METNINLSTTCFMEHQIKTGVYCILNTIDNKFYIGSVLKKSSTKKLGFRRRWQHHLHILLKNKHSNKHLQNAFNKYGREAFKFLILEIVDDESLILEREQYWIDVTNCLNREIGYNIYPFAQAVNKDFKSSKETRKKLRQINLGKPRPQWLKELLGTPVQKYSLDGFYIEEYKSIQDASNDTGIQRQDIGKCCLNKIQRAGSFQWKYKDSDKIIVKYKGKYPYNSQIKS